MTKMHYQVYQDSVERYVWVQITETGVETAAMTGDGLGGNHWDQARNFPVKHADKPFLYFIVDRGSDTILLSGRITNPEGWVADHGSNLGHIVRVFGWMIFVCLLLTTCYCGGVYGYYRLQGVRGREALPCSGQHCVGDLLARCCWRSESGHEGFRAVPNHPGEANEVSEERNYEPPSLPAEAPPAPPEPVRPLETA